MWSRLVLNAVQDGNGIKVSRIMVFSWRPGPIVQATLATYDNECGCALKDMAHVSDPYAHLTRLDARLLEDALNNSKHDHFGLLHAGRVHRCRLFPG